LTRAVTRVKVGPVQTRIRRPARKLAAVVPPPTDKVKALLPKLSDLPAEAEAREKTVGDLKRSRPSTRRATSTTSRYSNRKACRRSSRNSTMSGCPRQPGKPFNNPWPGKHPGQYILPDVAMTAHRARTLAVGRLRHRDLLRAVIHSAGRVYRPVRQSTVSAAQS
jgi:hypothetical protein